MSDPESVFELIEGDSPLLISVPHAGHRIPEQIACDMTPVGRSSVDSDWLVDRLYRPLLDQGHGMIAARWSRFVIDLNRPSDQSPLYPGQIEAGLCPTHAFDGRPLYVTGKEPDPTQIQARIERYWQPYHDALAAALAQRVERFGVALLWDAHSIRSVVPRLFDGQLPALNFGSFNDQSCEAAGLEQIVSDVDQTNWSTVTNQRFRGGYITRHYGQAGGPIRSLQLELSQRTYLDEPALDVIDDLADIMRQAWSQERADSVTELLARLLARFTDWGLSSAPKS